MSDGRTVFAVTPPPALWHRLDRRIELFEGSRPSGRGVLLIDSRLDTGGYADWSEAIVFLQAVNPAEQPTGRE